MAKLLGSIVGIVVGIVLGLALAAVGFYVIKGFGHFTGWYLEFIGIR